VWEDNPAVLVVVILLAVAVMAILVLGLIGGGFNAGPS
jgi:hypothetical protein